MDKSEVNTPPEEFLVDEEVTKTPSPINHTTILAITVVGIIIIIATITWFLLPEREPTESSPEETPQQLDVVNVEPIGHMTQEEKDIQIEELKASQAKDEVSTNTNKDEQLNALKALQNNQ